MSRSTLLYYDSIGLLKPSGRTAANYRKYSEDDLARLYQICVYREAGIPLKEIKELLDNCESKMEKVLKKKLDELNKEIHKLRIQQKLVVEMLKTKKICSCIPLMTKEKFVELLEASGLDDAAMQTLHAEFERTCPDEHQNFLEFLGITETEIALIREYSRKGNSAF